ncbi:MAG TPA: TIGR03089 family protein [Natronosporangium sp.]
MRDDETLPETIPAAFAAATATDPARPLLTWYDDGTGERTELSGLTCANWLAKTANLLVDGLGLGTGDPAVVAAPPHWQTAAIQLGCWAAGLRLVTPDSAAEVVFATPDRATRYAGGPGLTVFGLALAPLAAPMRDAPPGVLDYVVEVRAHGDRFDPVAAPDDPAVDDRSHRQLCRDAAARASALGIFPGARVLIDVDAHPDPLDWLLAPLVVGASTVLCGRLDPAALGGRIEAERVDHVLVPRR